MTIRYPSTGFDFYKSMRGLQMVQQERAAQWRNTVEQFRIGWLYRNTP